MGLLSYFNELQLDPRNAVKENAEFHTRCEVKKRDVMGYRVFYAAGPGNVIQSHKHWMRGEEDPGQLSITFSSQFEQFCRNAGAEAYIVSYFGKKELLREGLFTLEHRPKPMPSGRTGNQVAQSVVPRGEWVGTREARGCCAAR